MTPRRRRLLALLAFIVLLPAISAGGGGSQDLEPSDDLFSWVEPPEPYKLAVRSALLGEHPYRKCQLLAIPSFQAEWAVYVVREDDSEPLLVSKQIKRHLWTEMMEVISDKHRKKSYSIGPQAQTAALETLSIEVSTATTELPLSTVDLLENVWARMLSRVRYPAEPRIGLDGITYHVSHWSTDLGFRSGQTWSPDEGSRPAALVQLAEQMKVLADASTDSGRAQLETEARALLTQME